MPNSGRRSGLWDRVVHPACTPTLRVRLSCCGSCVVTYERSVVSPCNPIGNRTPEMFTAQVASDELEKPSECA